ncbi:BnaAnng31100D [Brassica napus]|uniref:BnaAnng31100D protein n=1 Tax=Brassica napus TaxID=3708 RepID=A0A078JPY7_BRANA|nr:BnaAnng31100D [Brassica napus]
MEVGKKEIYRIRRKIKPGPNLLEIDGSDSNITGRERSTASSPCWETDHQFTFRKQRLPSTGNDRSVNEELYSKLCHLQAKNCICRN